TESKIKFFFPFKQFCRSNSNPSQRRKPPNSLVPYLDLPSSHVPYTRRLPSPMIPLTMTPTSAHLSTDIELDQHESWLRCRTVTSPTATMKTRLRSQLNHPNNKLVSHQSVSLRGRRYRSEISSTRSEISSPLRRIARGRQMDKSTSSSPTSEMAAGGAAVV
ncbi:hypothetical protein LINGRAHAP2_LOCUS9588, partial [Linum grandiflorum]